MARRTSGKTTGKIKEVTDSDSRRFDIIIKNISLSELVALNQSDAGIQNVCDDLGNKISKLDEEAQEADARFDE